MPVEAVRVLNAARMLAIEAAAVVGGAISGDDLILSRYDGTTFNAGNVRGNPGTMTQAELQTQIENNLATTGTPELLGTAARGVATKGARSDHVHPGPRGVLGYAQVTASQGSISGSVIPLNGLTTTVTVGAGRRIKVTGHSLMENPTSGVGSYFYIYEGVSTIRQRKSLLHGYASFAEQLHAEVVLTPAAGTYTYSLKAVGLTQSHSVMIATPEIPSFILVEDIGAA